MEAKLEELTRKIYLEGVEKAKTEADAILSKARQDAETIINEAKKKSDDVLSNAKKDADKLTSKSKSEIKMAGEQAVTTLKQQVTGLMSNSIITEGVKGALADNEFVKNLIKSMVDKWEIGVKGVDLNLVLGGGVDGEFAKFFKAQASDLLAKGLEIKFEDRMAGGFKIGPKDNTFVVSFSDKDFVSFFQSFLKPMTREILFGGE